MNKFSKESSPTLNNIPNRENFSEKDYSKNLGYILNHAPAMICIVKGPDHVFEVANERYLQLVGYRDIIGKKVREALPDVKNQGFFEILDNVYKTGEPFVGNELPIQLEIKGTGPKQSYLDFVYQPIRENDGKINGIFVHAVDVTEKVLARKKIEESEHRYVEMVNSSPSLIATFKGENFIIEIANDAILEVWGKGKNVIGKPLLEVIPELVDQGLDKILQDVYRTGKPYKAYEMPLELFRNGKMELCHFNFIYYPQRDVNGEIIGVVDIATEVTPQALLHKQMKESESYFRQMADLMPDKVTNTDPEGKLIYLNQNWLDYTGMDSEELVAHSIRKLIHPQDRKEFLEKWESSLATGKNFEMECRFLNKNGKYIWHINRGQAVRNEEGKIIRWIITTTEIQRLKEEEKRKEDFLKMVSHELKTPVTSIKGYVQLLLSLLKKSKDAKVSSLPIETSLERIDHQIVRLTRLISEMLDLSRLEENKLELKKENFSINEMVEETVQDIILTNTQHHITISHDFKCEVFADRDRIGQVLINLVTNAIKYSPESQNIEIAISKYSEDRVSVNVKDEGIGIAKKDQEKIFNRFYRVGGGKSEETYSGFGIGLYLANEIIRRHNGFISVKSEKGKGSNFCFTLSVASSK